MITDKNLKAIKIRLEYEVNQRNTSEELNNSRPDPIMPARVHKEERVSLLCALFGYGRADSIIKFLSGLDFSLLEADEAVIEKELSSYYYRFQSSQDVIEIFKTLRRMKQVESIENIFYQGYRVDENVLAGLNATIVAMKKVNSYESRGYNFLVGKPTLKTKGSSAMKRWMMYLRWMVRCDHIDMGLWTKVDKKDLIMPLDTHTFNVSRRLGLLERKQYDLHAALELTQTLRTFDKTDPVKYDFALYRLGQEKVL